MAVSPKNILITGGMGFIGRHLVLEALKDGHNVIVIDSLTYAADPETAQAWNERLEQDFPGRYQFVNEDIGNFPSTEQYADYEDTFDSNDPSSDSVISHIHFRGKDYTSAEFLKLCDIDWIFHLAADSSEPRSRAQPEHSRGVNGFFAVNFLTDTAAYWGKMIEEWHELPAGEEKDRLAEKIQTFRVVPFSTDKVIGNVGKGARRPTEESPCNPASPYAEAKKQMEQIALALHDTTSPEWLEENAQGYKDARYKFYHDMPFSGYPVVIPRLVNVVGTGQNEEKMLPGIVKKMLRSSENETVRKDDKPLTIYGKDIIHSYILVANVCRGALRMLEFGRPGQIYHLSDNCELTNLQAIRIIADTFEELSTRNPPVIPKRKDGRPYNDPSLFLILPPREGDDEREALDASKAMREIGFIPAGEGAFRQAVEEVIVDEYKRWTAGQSITQADVGLSSLEKTLKQVDTTTFRGGEPANASQAAPTRKKTRNCRSR